MVIHDDWKKIRSSCTPPGLKIVKMDHDLSGSLALRFALREHEQFVSDAGRRLSIVSICVHAIVSNRTLRSIDVTTIVTNGQGNFELSVITNTHSRKFARFYGGRLCRAVMNLNCLIAATIGGL